ncbi:unnamed protein product [Phytophthora fragariaefolia]|uniref:Unnamed protein product n=1 Tax=Phytophthora fragariaefolia TaxID=1490495 RepID=A0A9W6Y762_9STRA|nr:unnamed protein product [Phytophthora fragariaefolia]
MIAREREIRDNQSLFCLLEPKWTSCLLISASGKLHIVYTNSVLLLVILRLDIWRKVFARKLASIRDLLVERNLEVLYTQDQPNLEPAVQDAHQASPDTGAREGVNEVPPEDSERGPNSESQDASTPDALAQASVGDAVKIEPPAADETSESSSPVQDVVTLEDADDESARLTCKEEGPLPVVQLEPATCVPTGTEQPSLDVSTSSPATQLTVQTLSPESMAVQVFQMIIDLTGEALPNTPPGATDRLLLK